MAIAAVALVSAGAPAAHAVAPSEPARAVTALGAAGVRGYQDFRRRAESLVDALVEGGVLQRLRGRVGRREVDRLVGHWRNLKALDSPGDQVAYVLRRFGAAEAQIDAALRDGAPREAVRALAAGPRSPVMEALYMAIVASALEEGRPAFRERGRTSELDGILVSFGDNFWLIRLMYRVEFPATAEHRFSRGLHQLGHERDREDGGWTGPRDEG